MAKQEYSEDIERLENRMRTNFFEIEKRLSGLEKMPHREAADEQIERMQEIEDLQMLLQAEVLQIKQQVLGEGAEFHVGDIEKRVERVEEKIEKGVAVSVNEDLARRVENMEKMKDTGEARKMLTEINEKIKGAKPFDDRKLMAEMEQKLKSMRPDDGLRRDFESLTKKVSELEKYFRESMGHMAGRSPDSQKIADMEKSMKENAEYIRRRVSELENVVESSGKMLTEPAMKKFLGNISETKNEIIKKTEDFESARERMDKLLRERQSLLQRLDDSEVNISKAETMLSRVKAESAKLENAAEKLSVTEERLKKMIDERLGEAESLRSELFERADKIGEKYSVEMQKYSAIREEFSLMMDALKKRLGEIEQIGSDFNGAVENAVAARIDGISKDIESRVMPKLADDSRVAALERDVEEMHLLRDTVRGIEKSLNNSMMNEDRLYEESTKLLNEYMKKFSSYIDEKIAKTMKKEISEDLKSELSRSLASEKYQGSENIISKISAMESQIRSLSQALRSFSTRSAVILE